MKLTLIILAVVLFVGVDLAPSRNDGNWDHDSSRQGTASDGKYRHLNVGGKHGANSHKGHGNENTNDDENKQQENDAGKSDEEEDENKNTNDDENNQQENDADKSDEEEDENKNTNDNDEPDVAHEFIRDLDLNIANICVIGENNQPENEPDAGKSDENDSAEGED